MTEEAPMRDLSVDKLFEIQASRRPHAIAVACGSNSLTYGELNRRANRLAQQLRQLGVDRDSLVGLCADRSCETLVGLLGILKAGGAYLPLDPIYPADWLSFVIADSQTRFIVTHDHLRSRLYADSCQFVTFEEQSASSSTFPDQNPGFDIEPDGLMYAIYTSGSTGRPKCVLVTHRNVVRLFEMMRRMIDFRESDVWTLFHSYGFGFSIWEMWGALLHGSRLVVVTEDVARSPRAFGELLEREGVTVLSQTPSSFRSLNHADPHFPGRTNHSLRRLVLSGEKIFPQDLEAWWNKPGTERVEVVDLYAMTETAGPISCQMLSPQNVPQHPLLEPGTILADTEFFIVDERLHPITTGVVGELCVAGPGIARGYLNRPELTAERFVTNPLLNSGKRVYRTGELGRRRTDGSIELVGRVDDQIKLRGYRIERGEIERALREHPSIADAAVDLDTGSGEASRLVAYLVPRKNSVGSLSHSITEDCTQFGEVAKPRVGTEPRDSSNSVKDAAIVRSTALSANEIAIPGVTSLRSFLGEILPDYMIPASFVWLDALPLNPNGKPDRQALPKGRHKRPVLDVPYHAPQVELERQLVRIWGEILSVEGIGIHDNFFELGGHSLLAARVIARLREEQSVELPIQVLFENPTVAGLARQMANDSFKPSAMFESSLRRVPREAKQPLSFAQQRLWFLDRLQSGMAAYNVSCGVWLRGQLNAGALEDSLHEIVRRHESLRTTIVEDIGDPIQRIGDGACFRLETIDLRAIPGSNRQPLLEEMTTEEAHRPFDLSSDLLLRARLYQLADDEHLLTCTQHHIASDGWSSAIFWRELAVAYEAFDSGRAPLLAEMPFQYADYASWQREWLQSGESGKQLAFWKDHLAGAPRLLDLPLDFPRPAVQTFHGARQTRILNREVVQSLKKIGHRQGATMFMTLLAAWQVLLSRYSSQLDVVVGIPVAGRNRTELEGLIGFFVNTLALRVDLSGNPRFVDLLKQVKEVSLGAFAHQNLPFEKLIEELNPERNPSHSPLFQVMFAFQNIPQSPPSLPGLEVTPFEVPCTTSKFDLSLSIEEHSSGLRGTLEYNTDLFRDETISRLLDNFQTLLNGIGDNPQCPVGELPLLSPGEQKLVLDEWNRTKTGPAYETCIHQLFEKQVDRSPDAPAVRFQQQELTYRQLNERANQLAHALIGMGVGPESLVGICMERSPDLIISLLAVLKAGGAYLPLDPVYPRDRLTFMLNDADVHVLLTQPHLRADLPDHHARVVCIDSDRVSIERESVENPSHLATPDNLAYVIYTSGSTGHPKGVMICHRSVCNYMQWRHSYFPLSSKDRLLQTASISFDDSVWQIFEPLTCGAILVLVDSGGVQDMASLVQLIVRHGITATNFVPSLLRAFLDEPGVVSCRSLRRVTTGGETLSIELQNRFFELLPARLYNGYGPTEATIGSTFWTCERNNHRESIPIGRPVANVEVYVLDQHLQPTPIGVPGELSIGGIGLARGYLNRPELTAEKFIPNPLSGNASDRLYRTGDRVRWSADGNLEFLGRLDHQIKLRGFRIELGEIETAMNGCPNVEVSVVVLQEAIPGEQQLVAYVVPHSDAPETFVSQLRSLLARKLPGYMIPSSILVIDHLPLTPNGKLDRKALPVPDRTSLQSARVNVGSRNPTERTLVAIWSKLLGRDELGVHDNFFELGGHSLLAAKMITLASSQLKDLRLTLRDLFEAPTIAGLVSRIASTAIDSSNVAHPDATDLRSDREPFERATLRSRPSLNALASHSVRRVNNGHSLQKNSLSDEPESSDRADIPLFHSMASVERDGCDPARYLEVLRAGDEGVPPVICVGDTRPLSYILKQMPPSVPLLLLKLDGVQVRPPEYFTLDEVVEVYRRAIQNQTRRHQAVVIGFSFGGVLAYQLATRLLQSGWTNVGTLLIEPSVPDEFQPVSARVIRWINQMRTQFGLTRHAAFRKLFSIGTLEQNLSNRDESLRHWDSMLPQFNSILRHAQLGPFTQPLVLVGTRFYHKQFAQYWAARCKGGIIPCVCPERDGHFSSFQEVNCQRWLAELEALYEQIKGGGGPKQGTREIKGSNSA